MLPAQISNEIEAGRSQEQDGPTGSGVIQLA